MDKHDSRLKRLFFLLAWGSLILFASSCKTADPKPQEIKFRDNKIVFSKWEEVFDYRGVVSFKTNDVDMEIFSVGNIEINASGETILQDGRVRKIMLFDNLGKYLHDIGREGEGPGEFLIPIRFCLDKNQNLYLFDQLKRIIIKYSYPGYSYDRQVRLDDSIADIFIDGEDNFIIYRLASQKNRLLFKYDKSGKFLKSSLIPKQEKLSIFIKRFLIGEIADIPGEGFLFIYPEEYKIYLMSYDLEVKKVLVAEIASMYYPAMGEFPAHLSPYDFTKAHVKWLEKSLFPTSLYHMGKGIFIINLAESFRSGNNYINVHDLDGITYARGLQVPFSGIIRYGRNGDVFVVEDSVFDDKGNVLPLKLHRYKLKNLKRP